MAEGDEGVLKKNTKKIEERGGRKKRCFICGLSVLIEAVYVYQILHVSLNPFEILGTA